MPGSSSLCTKVPPRRPLTPAFAGWVFCRGLLWKDQGSWPAEEARGLLGESGHSGSRVGMVLLSEDITKRAPSI